MWENMNMGAYGWSVRGQYYRIAAFCIKCEACGFMRQISSTHLAGAGRTIRPPRGVCKPSSERVPHHNSDCLRLLEGFVSDVRVLRCLQDVLRKSEGTYICLSIRNSSQQTINGIDDKNC